MTRLSYHDLSKPKFGRLRRQHSGYGREIERILTPTTVDNMTPADAKAKKRERIASLKKRIAELQNELAEWESL